MKKMKQLGSLLLAVMLTVALSCPAFAAEETYTITINNAAAGHTYEAYQIFSGDLFEGKLSNIEWGTGVNTTGQTKLGDAVAKAESLGNSADDAANFAKVVAPYLQNPAASSGPADGKYTISNLPAGYYLVKDQDNSLANKDDFYTAYIMEVVGNVTADLKGDKPTVEKKVKDINDTTDVAAGEWQDSADHDIGDVIDFQLKGTVAANYGDYETYKFAFHDVESDGLTFDANSVKAYVAGVEIDSKYYTVNTDTTDKCTFEILFPNLKKINSVEAGSVITVEYKATLNADAVIGSQGNPNKVSLEYSNNPNDTQGGETGKTPEDTVIVFTYKVTVDKVDTDRKPLKGAEFTLYKKLQGDHLKPITTTTNVNENTTSFEFTGLDDGEYVLKETKTPAGYNTISDITFEIVATHQENDANPELKNLTGNPVTGVIEFTVDKDAGSLSTDIVNKTGSELPSTGGMGTKVLYTVGGVLVVCAGVTLVAKKRMQ